MLFYVILKRHKIKLMSFETQDSKPCNKIFLNSKDRFLFPNEFSVLQILCDKQRKFSLTLDSTQPIS